MYTVYRCCILLMGTTDLVLQVRYVLVFIIIVAKTPSSFWWNFDLPIRCTVEITII